MAYDVDRQPGAWVRRQATRRERIFWTSLAAGFAATGVFLFFALGHRASIAASFAFLAAMFAVRPYAERYLDNSARWLHGAVAEESVGATLNELRRERWILMHDVEQAFEGNIDHIASGPNGVFLIETKLRRYDEDQLTKAKRQAAKLYNELGVFVHPVICLYHRRGKPFRTKGVAIVPSQHLLGWLRAQHEKPVDFERLARFADQTK